MPLSICWVGAADCFPDWNGISAIATAGATAVALFLPGYQRKLERGSKLRAARSALLPALNRICDYADEIAGDLVSLWPESTAMPVQFEATDHLHLYAIEIFKFPSFPVKAATALERIIEHSDDLRLCDRAASILREAQVLESRAAKRPPKLSRLSILEYVEQAVSVRCRAETLFPFARGTSSTCMADLWEQVDITLAVMEPMKGFEQINYHLDQVRMIKGPLGRGDQTL